MERATLVLRVNGGNGTILRDMLIAFMQSNHPVFAECVEDTSVSKSSFEYSFHQDENIDRDFVKAIDSWWESEAQSMPNTRGQFVVTYYDDISKAIALDINKSFGGGNVGISFGINIEPFEHDAYIPNPEMQGTEGFKLHHFTFEQETSLVADVSIWALNRNDARDIACGIDEEFLKYSDSSYVSETKIIANGTD